jgi:hypothetical protein
VTSLSFKVFLTKETLKLSMENMTVSKEKSISGSSGSGRVSAKFVARKDVKPKKSGDVVGVEDDAFQDAAKAAQRKIEAKRARARAASHGGMESG